MPKIISTTPAKPKVTAKFFHNDITGSGGKVGLLNDTIGPTNVNELAVRDYGAAIISSPIHDITSDVTTRFIPVDPIVEQLYGHIIAHGSNIHNGVKVAQSDKASYYFNVGIQSVVIYKNTAGPTNTAALYPRYRAEVYMIPNHLEDNAIGGTGAFIDNGTNQVRFSFSMDVPQTYEKLLSEHIPSGLEIDFNAVDEFLINYDFAQRFNDLALDWAEDRVSGTTVKIIESLANRYGNVKSPWSQEEFDAVQLQMKHLASHHLPLTGYAKIFKALKAAMPDEALEVVVARNQRLMVNMSLYAMDAVSASVTGAPAPTEKALATLDPRTTPEQKAAIIATEPFVMVQAGAGTGKSTTMEARINYLQALGVDGSEITALSFTNAAADNLALKAPSIVSRTNASLIQEIYGYNHPSHRPSEVETIINALSIRYPHSNISREMATLLLNIKQSRPSAMTDMTDYIRRNYDEVMAALDLIGQTTLELQIIICYLDLAAGRLKESKSTNTHFVIIDEVQDNSIYEFIFFLKRAAVLRQSVMIVGDASQCIYEFRSADSKALNALETSGVFATYRLTHNFRSEATVLEVANKVLATVEANEFANIYLTAHNNPEADLETFEKNISIVHNTYSKVRDFDENFESHYGNPMIRWAAPKLAAGESVTFISKNRKHVIAMEKILADAFPDKNVVNITSDRVNASTLLTDYIKENWDSVVQLYPAVAPGAIHKQISDDIFAKAKMMRSQDQAKKALGAMQAVLNDWTIKNGAAIRTMISRFEKGQITEAQFFEQLQANMEAEEIESNMAKRSRLQRKNQERKEANAKVSQDIVVSTIHGVKGLEYDNVAVLFHQRKTMTQEALREYYVALTRAKRCELILSYSTDGSDTLENTYQSIKADLEVRQIEKNRQALAKFKGVDAADISDEQLRDELHLLTESELQSKIALVAAALGMGPEQVPEAMVENIDSIIELYQLG